MVYHERILPALWDELFTGLSVQVLKLKFSFMAVSEQVRHAMSARGLISTAGAGLTWQIWMKAMSAVLVVFSPHGRYVCESIPETWHETTAIHLGHTAMSWRYCGTGEEFPKTRPSVVVERLLHMNSEAKAAGEGRTCVILNSHWNKRHWPRCDHYIRLKLPCSPLPSWPPFKKVGVPLLKYDHIPYRLVAHQDGV